MYSGPNKYNTKTRESKIAPGTTSLLCMEYKQTQAKCTAHTFSNKVDVC